jgi:hypothetical protein
MISADEYIEEAIGKRYTDTYPLNLEQCHQVRIPSTLNPQP